MFEQIKNKVKRLLEVSELRVRLDIEYVKSLSCEENVEDVFSRKGVSPLYLRLKEVNAEYFALKEELGI